MIDAIVLGAWIMTNAQAVAHAYEVDRCARVRPTCTAMPVERMPRPSSAWAIATAEAIISDPLLPGEPKLESVHMLIYAFGESTYRDPAVGDSGEAVCSLQVHYRDVGVSKESLLIPANCVRAARIIMRRSFRCWPQHPMACYAGGHNAKAAAIADARADLARRLTRDLPAIEP